MLVVETIVRIRREHASGKGIKTIARDLRLSRKVVRKAIRAPEGVFDYHRTVHLEARGCGDRGQADAGEVGPYAAVRIAGDLRPGLPAG